MHLRVSTGVLGEKVQQGVGVHVEVLVRVEPLVCAEGCLLVGADPDDVVIRRGRLHDLDDVVLSRVVIEGVDVVLHLGVENQNRETREVGHRVREAGYGEMALAPQNLLATFEGVMASNAVQDPRNVADAIVALVETRHGERSFRTIVDNLGMGDAVVAHNEGAGQMTAAIYGAFGMGHMLEVTTASA